jgi:hypothetical protein
MFLGSCSSQHCSRRGCTLETYKFQVGKPMDCSSCFLRPQSGEPGAYGQGWPILRRSVSAREEPWSIQRGIRPACDNTSTAPTTTDNNVNFIWDSHIEVNEIFSSRFTCNIVVISPNDSRSKVHSILFSSSLWAWAPFLSPFQYLTSICPSPHN